MRKVLAAWMAVLVIMAIAGCGRSGPMSLVEYRNEMCDLHDRAMGGLQEALEVLEPLDAGDYYALFDLSVVLEKSSGIFRSSYREALDIYTPLEVKEMHQEFLFYYSYSEEVTGDMASAASFFLAALPMLTDAQNLALPDIPEDSGVTRIKAASEEDVATMHGYTKNLKGMEPPEELEIYREKLIALFRSIEEAVAGVERAVTPEDRSVFTRFRQEFPAMLQRVRILQGEIAVYILFFRLRVEYLLEKGEELAGLIEEIQASPLTGIHAKAPAKATN